MPELLLGKTALQATHCQAKRVLQLDRIISAALTVTDEPRGEWGQRANRSISQRRESIWAFPQQKTDFSVEVSTGPSVRINFLHLSLLQATEEGDRSPATPPLTPPPQTQRPTGPEHPPYPRRLFQDPSQDLEGKESGNKALTGRD